MHPSIPQPAPHQQRSRVFLTEEQHLSDIRSRSCYKTLRAVINVLTLPLIVLDILGTILAMAGQVAIKQALPDASNPLYTQLITLAVGFVFCVLLVALRQSFLLLIDIADTLLYDHNRNRNA